MTRPIVRTTRARASHALQWAQLSVLFVGLAACSSNAVAPLPEESIAFVPPAQYALWWKMTEACSGRKADFNSIKWYHHADYSTPTNSSDGAVRGEYFYGLNSVVITDGSLNDPAVVRHEMLHALINEKGHPASDFRDSCGGLVTCFDACARSVGTIPVASTDAPTIDVTELQIRKQVMPDRISMTTDAGYFALTVEVTNPFPYPVWVRLRREQGDSTRAATFGFSTAAGARFDNVAGNLVSFGAGETKRVAYDLTVNDIPQVDGKKTVRAFYNSTLLDMDVLDVMN